jgi:hypothetical protein
MHQGTEGSYKFVSFTFSTPMSTHVNQPKSEKGPSGDPSPSEADLRPARRILEASKILQLQLVDHVIIGSPAPGRSDYFSFKEGGVIG